MRQAATHRRWEPFVTWPFDIGMAIWVLIMVHLFWIGFTGWPEGFISPRFFRWEFISLLVFGATFGSLIIWPPR